MTPDRVAAGERAAMWLWVLRLFSRHKLVFVGVLLCLVGLGATEPLIPLLVGGMIDAAGDPEAFALPIELVPVAFFMVLLVRASLTFAASYISSWLQFRLEYELRIQAAGKLLHWPAAQFKGMADGEVIYKVIDVPAQLCGSSVSVGTTVIQSLFKIIFYLLLLFYLDWYLTSFIVLVLPPLGLFLGKINKRIQKKSHGIINAGAQGIDYINELLRMWPIVRIFGGDGVERDKQRARFSNIFGLQLHRQKITAYAQPVILVVLAVPVSMLLAYYAERLSLGQTTAGEVTTYVSSVLLMLVAVRGFVRNITKLPLIAAYAKTFIELDNIAPERDSPLDTAESGNLAGKLPDRGDIVLQGVSFSYPGRDSAAISQLDLKIADGESIALVGASGAGKSTITSLLLRLFEPDEGQITFFGKPLADWPLAELRQRFAMVTQTPLLFNDTVANNIAYPEKPDMARVESALLEIGMPDFLQQLPMGLDTCIQSGNLSGGQQQMLALARAFYHAAPVVIFDEATSSLDSATEQLVKMGAKRLFANRTAIIIAHRFASIELADRVVVMDGGGIVDHGSSKELLERCGIFKRLWQAQQLHHSAGDAAKD